MSLMFSISGLRGIVGRDLTRDVIYQYAHAFGRFLKPGKVVIGRDTRKSGNAFRTAVIKGLNAAGCKVVDLGIVPTPTVLFVTKKLRAHGGIAITASHNPIQWNALKFINKRGQFLNDREFRVFAGSIDQKDGISRQAKYPANVSLMANAIENHIAKIISVMGTSAQRLRIGVDAVNGAGSIALPRLLEKMGSKVFRLNCKFGTKFPRPPEPMPENIQALCRFVRRNRLDLGFAVDPDCDRLAIVDEHGCAIGEDKTLVLVTDYILSKTKGRVVTNLSSTALMDYVVQKHDCRLYRTKVGEANVVAKMRSAKAIIGGEGNGGVVYPMINFTRDALVGAAIIVKLLSERKRTLSEITTQYPKYYMIKRKFRLSKARLENRRDKIIGAFKGRVSFVDGLKITARDYWLHIRPSNTEPLIRIIGEARDKKKIIEYISKVAAILKEKT